MDEVDLQRTVDENARRGVNFSAAPVSEQREPAAQFQRQPGRGRSTDQSNRRAAPHYGNGNNSATPATTPEPVTRAGASAVAVNFANDVIITICFSGPRQATFSILPRPFFSLRL